MPVGSGRQRGYRFRGALTIERLIGGEAIRMLVGQDLTFQINGLATRH
jgi:hypothetical protein